MAAEESDVQYCNARLRQNGYDPNDREKVDPGPHAGDGYCHNPVDEGRCRMHGGHGGRPIEHGLYSAKRDELREKLKKASDLDHKGSLEREVDVLRALLADFMDRMDEPDRDDLDAATKLLKEIRHMVDTIHKQMTRERLTKDEENQLLNSFAQIIRNYVPESDRDEALNELDAAVTSGRRRALEGGS